MEAASHGDDEVELGRASKRAKVDTASGSSGAPPAALAHFVPPPAGRLPRAARDAGLTPVELEAKALDKVMKKFFAQLVAGRVPAADLAAIEINGRTTNTDHIQRRVTHS